MAKLELLILLFSLTSLSLCDEYQDRLEHIEKMVSGLVHEVREMEEVDKENTDADSELISAMEATLNKRGMLPNADEMVVERRSDGDFVEVPYKKRLIMALYTAVDKVISEQKREKAEQSTTEEMTVDRRSDGDMVIVPSKRAGQQMTVERRSDGDMVIVPDKRKLEVHNFEEVDESNLATAMRRALINLRAKERSSDTTLSKRSEADIMAATEAELKEMMNKQIEERESEDDIQNILDAHQLHHSLLDELEIQKKEQEKIDSLMDEISDADNLEIARRAEKLQKEEIREFADYLEKKEHNEKRDQEEEAVKEQRKRVEEEMKRNEQIKSNQLAITEAEKAEKREMAKRIESQQIRAALQKRAEMEMKTASEEEAKRMADEQAKLQSINNANADLRDGDKRDDHEADMILSKLRQLLQDLI